MDLDKAFNLACDLMVEHIGHGLFAWTNKKRVFGEAGFSGNDCENGEPVIYLSRKLTELNSEAEVRNCILHEIAHLLTWGDGHGPRWKAKCVELGCRPETQYKENVRTPLPKYKLICMDCNQTLQGWYRKPKIQDASRYQCMHCNTVNCIIEGM